MPTPNSIDRFDPVIANYEKYRPDYPIQIVWYLKKIMQLDKDFVVADLGAGTGKSSMLLLPHVTKIYAIEPNAGMLNVARKLLGGNDNFVTIEATAEQTTLPDKSCDVVVAGHSFHWFDPEAVRAEAKRILKENRPAILMWNLRDHEASNFMRAYRDFVRMYSTDEVHERKNQISLPAMDRFFENGYEKKEFAHEMELDINGLKGIYLSYSFAYLPGHPRHEEVMLELEDLFYRFEYNGLVVMNYKTELYYGAFNKRQIVLWKKVVYHLLRIPAFFAYLFLLTGMFFSSLFRKLKRKLSGASKPIAKPKEMD